jgi:Cu/Ag efflux pump CusA
MDDLRHVSVSAPSGERIPIGQLAEIVRTDGLASTSASATRRVGIKWGVRDHDMGGLVAEAMQAMQKVQASVTLPKGLGATFNISAAVGYVAVFRVSVLDGVVLVSSIRQAQAEGRRVHESILDGCEIRFRPIIASGIVAVLGFLPAAVSHGIGAEIQRPLARS